MRLIAAAGVLALVWSGAEAHAASCGHADLLDTLPPDGAQGVPTDAALSARYAITAEHQGEEVLLGREGEPARAVKATFDRVLSTLTARPEEPLAPGTAYVVTWPGLRSVSTGGRAAGATVRFTTSAGPDRAAPEFAGLERVAWDLRRDQNDCTDSQEDRLVFDLTLGAASDDGGRASLALEVFQTAGPTLADGARAVLSRAIPAEGARVRVALPVDEAVGRICFAALVRDLVGQTSGGGDREVCAETTAPPFFYGCAVAGARGSPVGFAPLLALLWAVSRRRRASRSSRVV